MHERFARDLLLDSISASIRVTRHSAPHSDTSLHAATRRDTLWHDAPRRNTVNYFICIQCRVYKANYTGAELALMQRSSTVQTR